MESNSPHSCRMKFVCEQPFIQFYFNLFYCFYGIVFSSVANVLGFYMLDQQTEVHICEMKMKYGYVYLCSSLFTLMPQNEIQTNYLEN